jgi:hypothetical protein
LKNSDVSNEIGSYKFISDLTGLSVNRVFNIVVLIIIVVCDPLAVVTLIGLNKLTMRKPDEIEEEREEDDDKIINDFKKNKLEKIVKPVASRKIEEEPKRIVYKYIPNLKEEQEHEFEETITEDKLEDTKKNSFSEICPDGYEEAKIDLVKDNIKEGLKVYHEIFGNGKIIKSDLIRNRIFVQFEDYGVKELDPDYAKLQEIVCVEAVTYLEIKSGESLPEPEIKEFIKEEPLVEKIEESKMDEVIEPKILDNIIETYPVEEDITSEKKTRFFWKNLMNLRKKK